MGTSTGAVKLIYASIAAAFFIFLGSLFGNQIMAFIFGFLGPDTAGLVPGDPGYNESLQNQINSLEATNAYSERASTVSVIVIVYMVIASLVALFLLFKDTFMGSKKSKSRSSGGFGAPAYD